MDMPEYTPAEAPVPEGEIVIERGSTPQDIGPRLNRTAADVVRFLMAEGEMVTATQSLTDDMIELFAASTGRRPLVMGKPMTSTVDYLTRLLGCERDELAFVGDRLATDIAIGAQHGIPSALVLTGVTTLEEYKRADVRADAVVERLSGLCEFL